MGNARTHKTETGEVDGFSRGGESYSAAHASALFQAKNNLTGFKIKCSACAEDPQYLDLYPRHALYADPAPQELQNPLTCPIWASAPLGYNGIQPKWMSKGCFPLPEKTSIAFCSTTMLEASKAGARSLELQSTELQVPSAWWQ
uniref:HDC19889 n=1 Tax=Drosophila melanogaster TaxID=7227 RepID=Q6II34_DROME|nr:TPA_inf: HDC19889 [Drosophila melanogaster]